MPGTRRIESLIRRAIDLEIDRARQDELGEDFIEKLEQLKKLVCRQPSIDG